MGTVVRLLAVALSVLTVCSTGVWALEGPWGLSLKVGGTYNDNRDGVDVDQDEQFELWAQPRVDFKYDQENTVLDLYYSPSALWRSNPREDDSGNPQNDSEVYHALGAGLTHKFSPIVALRLADDLVRTDDPQIDEGGTAIREDMTYLANDAKAGLTVNMNDKTIVELTGGSTMKRYEEDAVAVDGDEDTWSGGAALKYLVARDLYGMAHAEVEDYEFDSTSQIRGGMITTCDLGLEHSFTPSVLGRASAGVQSVDYESEDMDSDSSGYGRLEAVVSGADTKLGVAASYGLAGPYVQPYSSQVRTYVGANLERAVVEDVLTLALQGQYGKGEYDPENGEPGGDDELLMGVVKGTFKVNQNLALEMSYQYEDWTSDVRESFTRNTISAGINAKL